MKIKKYNDIKNDLRYVSGMNERYLIEELKEYIYQNDFDAYNRICLLYGLRRTGKTTMMYQTINDMSEVLKEKSVYIVCDEMDSPIKVAQTIENMIDSGYSHFFVDEVTAMEEFVGLGAVFSDWFASGDVRVVLSGTDSLSLYLAEGSSLLDRCKMIHTTLIPFYEFQHLFPKATIDDFIEYGGTLSHEKNGLGYFQNPNNTQKYVDEAICDNILRSLENDDKNYTYYELEKYYSAKQIKNIIHRIIVSDNHLFIKNIVLKKFRLSDYSKTHYNLSQRKDDVSKKLVKEMDDNDKEFILDFFKNKLEIFDFEEKDDAIEVTDETVYILKKYLEKLDFMNDAKYILVKENYEDLENPYKSHSIVSQPGIRYSEAKILAESIGEYYRKFNKDESHKKMIVYEILSSVKGGLLEDIIFSNTQRILPEEYEVLKITFDKNLGVVKTSGEFDIVIQNKKTYECHLFEIKHDNEVKESQVKNLLDPDKVNWVEQRFGKVKSKVVLYNGVNIPKDDRGIIYKNCTEFLNELKEFDRNYQRHIERAKDACIQCLDDPFYVDKKGLKRSFEENGMEYTMVVWEENPNQYEIYDDANNLVENGVIEELDREDLKKRAKQLANKMNKIYDREN